MSNLEFVGWRLKEALEARCMSVISVAEIIGVSRQTIYQYIDGDIKPGIEMVTELAKLLKCQASFFYRKQEVTEPSHIFFRSLKSANELIKSRARRRLAWLEDIALFLAESVEMPKLNLPNFENDMPASPFELTGEQIEELATKTRRFWELKDGPISNVLWLLENNGILIGRDDLVSEKMDGLSGWGKRIERPLILLGKEKASAVRSRFDAAHELGHLILHRNIDITDVKNEAGTWADLEKQAHRFASAFLFPKESFLYQTFNMTLDEFLALKPTWKLSVAMMVTRADNLGLISENQKSGLNVNLNRRKNNGSSWRVREPLDDNIPIETPHILKESICLLVEQGIFTKSEIKLNLPYDESDIETLCGLPNGFLAEQPPSIKIIDITKPENQ